jgi:PAS domain S-box-containing protein
MLAYQNPLVSCGTTPKKATEMGQNWAIENPPSETQCWQAFLESCLMGVAVTEVDGRYIVTNSIFLDLLGCSENEIERMCLPEFTDPPNSDGQRGPFAELVKGEKGHFKMEKAHRRRDGSVIWLKASVFIHREQPRGNRFVIAFLEDIGEAKQAEFQAVDDERRRLAQELHDTTGQNVVAILLDLELVGRHTENLNSRASSALNECVVLAQQSLREIRTLSYLLHPPMLDELGFVSALHIFAQHFAERSGMQIELDMPDTHVDLPSEMELTLFRVAQEGITNAHRHAQSSTVFISMSVGETTVTFRVANTTPASPRKEFVLNSPTTGVGIAGMRQRVQQLGGDLQLRSDEGQTILEAVIPLPKIEKNNMRHAAPIPLRKKPEIRDASHRRNREFQEIIGQGPGLEIVFRQVEMVAGTDSSVLILGETGTGKELIARAIHNISSRRERRFVASSCSCVPAGLLESALFGHEKGAFTGAVAQQIGRIELADKGTLFLDEVGDISLELQSKLLRVLQEQEIERIGSTHTISVDFRLVSATNRPLAEMVDEGEFRSDLYYRLNVFPIELPALRDRREDIPLLVWHFANAYAKRMNKRIETIREEDLDALTSFHWPGNVRELQNVIERAVIMSPDTVLHRPVLTPPLAQPKRADARVPSDTQTLADAERDHILRALDLTNWTVGGPHGAAVRLGILRTTLIYKMQRLGITRPVHRVRAARA